MYHEIIVLGVAVSLLFGEITGLSSAGLVVPGYIALSLNAPLRIAYTLLIVFLSMGAVRLLSLAVILYGRRRFALMVLVSFALTGLAEALFPAFTPGVIGYLVPGIMGREFERSGIFPSLLSLGIVVGILALVMLWMGLPVFPS